MLKEDVLAGLEGVGGVAQGVHEGQGRRLEGAIFHAGVSGGGKAERERDGGGFAEPLRADDAHAGGGGDGVGELDGDAELNSTGGEVDEEGVKGVFRFEAGGKLGCVEAEVAGGTEEQVPAAGEGDVGSGSGE